MQLFHCPFCGPRDQSEFTYIREATAVPALNDNQENWQKYVYERENQRGLHPEWWHHNHGCRQILRIVRDTMTHQVLEIEAARSEKGQR